MSYIFIAQNHRLEYMSVNIFFKPQSKDVSAGVSNMYQQKMESKKCEIPPSTCLSHPLSVILTQHQLTAPFPLSLHKKANNKLFNITRKFFRYKCAILKQLLLLAFKHVSGAHQVGSISKNKCNFWWTAMENCYTEIVQLCVEMNNGVQRWHFLYLTDVI